MLVSQNVKICVAPNAKPKLSVTPNAKPQCKSVEYRLRWVPNTKCSRWPCTFLFFVLISFALGSVFQWNMGFSLGINEGIHIPRRMFHDHVVIMITCGWQSLSSASLSEQNVNVKPIVH